MENPYNRLEAMLVGWKQGVLLTGIKQATEQVALVENLPEYSEINKLEALLMIMELTPGFHRITVSLALPLVRQLKDIATRSDRYEHEQQQYERGLWQTLADCLAVLE